MIFDAQTRFSNAQAVTSTAASTNTIDLLAAGIPYGASAAVARDQGVFGIPLHIQVVESFATLTSLTVSVQTDDNDAFSSATTVIATQAIPAADLTAGYVFNIGEIPLKTRERYLRLNYTVAGSSATAGKITAGIVAASQRNPLSAAS
ncbi:Bbp16 family capsid cement protein [Brevundimonas sp.]|uniref:Bbp16 family capsid cement protein n=1 Tax=Brevundimonas sp. TaxID=1871086 RepID=UPI0035B03FE9